MSIIICLLLAFLIVWGMSVERENRIQDARLRYLEEKRIQGKERKRQLVMDKEEIARIYGLSLDGIDWERLYGSFPPREPCWRCQQVLLGGKMGYAHCENVKNGSKRTCIDMGWHEKKEK